MATDKQIAASRANGARSRGPITPEGRLRCSLLAQAVVLEGESRPLFSQLLRSMQAELQPQGVIENMMVQKMAVAQWRQFRAWGMEKATIAHDARNAGKHDTRHWRCAGLPQLQQSYPGERNTPRSELRSRLGDLRKMPRQPPTPAGSPAFIENKGRQ